ncbi:MAG TPA: FtsW/RodA/SpoVE family cell cycle protein, partial [Candidatus Limnocylindria bacterium]|nr:FtsW/RodA/SpoVE family cell cycle protein [Candidatus Limnocylindria bacterium]
MSSATPVARRGSGTRTQGVRRERHAVSYPLLIAVLALVAIGVVMVYSASSVQSYLASDDPAAIGLQQAIWAVLGLSAMLVASRLDFRLLRYLAIPLYIGTMVLLVAVLIPGIGTEAFGSRRWITVPGLGQFQPAEIAKLAICVYLAHWLDRAGRNARSFWNGFVPFGLLVAPGFLLIALEPDLGTAGVYAITAVAIFFMAGANLLYLGAIGSGLVGAAVLMISSTPYQLQRVETFLDPFREPLGAGYNTIQGLFALALGGLMGQGLGASKLKYLYLPAPST